MRARTATIGIAATAGALGLFCAGLLAGGAFDHDQAGAQARPAAPTPAQPRPVRLPAQPPEEKAGSPTGVRAGTIKGELASRRKDVKRRRAARRRARPAAPRRSAPRRKAAPSGSGKAKAQSNSPPATPQEQAKAKKPRRKSSTQTFRSVTPPAAPVPIVPAPQPAVEDDGERHHAGRRHHRHGHFSGRDGPDRRRRWW